MTIFDQQLVFSDDQAVTSTAASTNVIDQGAPNDLGPGEELWVYGVVTTTATAAGAATVTFALQTDDNDAFSSATTLWTSAAIGKATLVDGYEFVKLRIPHGTEQYLRLNYTVASGPLTAGTFLAGIVRGVPGVKIYAQAAKEFA